jgi:hypothetical protein
MNLKYLKEVIIPQRKKEIEEGKNAGTANPIYVVLDLNEHVVSGHSDYYLGTNLKEVPCKFGYLDTLLDTERIKFRETNKGMKQPEDVTQFFTDRIIAFFLTRKGAEEYLKYQSHNLSKHAYIYVFTPGYGNYEADMIFGKE